MLYMLNLDFIQHLSLQGESEIIWHTGKQKFFLQHVPGLLINIQVTTRRPVTHRTTITTTTKQPYDWEEEKNKSCGLFVIVYYYYY